MRAGLSSGHRHGEQQRLGVGGIGRGGDGLGVEFSEALFEHGDLGRSPRQLRRLATIESRVIT